MIEEKKILTKTLKHESFKKYRNQKINLLTVSKQTHYNKCFEEKIRCPKNKKKLNFLTFLINEGKTITNPRNIVEHCNNFFTKLEQIYKITSHPLENIIQTTS